MPAYKVLVKRLMSECIWLDVGAPDQESADCKAIETMEEGFCEIDDLFEVDEDESWEIDKSFCCLDCGVCTSRNGEYPLMIRNELWYQIVPGGEGMLCRADMERRLGRPLTEEDLIPLPKDSNSTTS